MTMLSNDEEGDRFQEPPLEIPRIWLAGAMPNAHVPPAGRREK